ncbi:hypothetical protein [Thiohalocapsa marina]|uniref:hypothetical protein n=1 Tax=Thiohalocapsa marina TaxID=424902 RepID=UPI0036DC95E8
MVKVINVSSYTEAEPPVATADKVDRKIRGLHGPIYSPDAVLAAADGQITPWTRRCLRTVQALGFDAEDLARLLRDALRHGRYKDSEWCAQSSDEVWAACDAYVLCRREWNEKAFKELECEYYIKFAIAKTGRILLLVSCHLS